MWITTRRFLAAPPRRSPLWAKPSSSTGSPSATLPLPKPKAKSSVNTQFWQNRLPAYFAAQKIKTLEAANPHIEELRGHHNATEIHRELKMPAQHAWDLALKEKRLALRPVPNCPWWP